MTTVTDTAAASQGRAIAYWLATALDAFALGGLTALGTFSESNYRLERYAGL